MKVRGSKAFFAHGATFVMAVFLLDSVCGTALASSNLITNGSFEKIVRENIAAINSYKTFLEGKHILTAYTIIRHIVYLYDKKNYADILYENQKISFHNWLNNRH